MILEVISLKRPVSRVVLTKHHLGLGAFSLLLDTSAVIINQMIQVFTRLHSTSKGHSWLVLLDIAICYIWDLSMLQSFIEALLEFLFLELQCFSWIIIFVEGI